jgi:mRNA-degrading endonuclease YafQ of YafQ-DinJ toxin-antitoxin module
VRIKTKTSKTKKLNPKPQELSNAYYHTYMRVSHLRQVDLPRYRVDHVENNAGLRIKYMRNQISKEEFQKQVQQANKRYEKKREIYGVIQLLITAVTDILYRVKQHTIECDDTAFEKAFQTFLEVDKITEYTNECLLDIANTYNSKPKKIVDLEFDKPVKA